MTVLNNLLILNNKTQLWKSDGTAEGTSVIKKITNQYTQLVVMNNKVYFGGDSTSSNPAIDQLWETDGTASGTKLVKTINPSGAAHIGTMYVYGGKIYFYAWDGVGYYGQPWISDGTTAGTTELKVVKSTLYNDANPSSYTPYNGKLYFSMWDDSSACQLWVTDGTPDGTLKVTNLNPKNGFGLSPASLTVFNSKLFFRGYDENKDSQLWSTDGTASGTIKVKVDSTLPNGYHGFWPNSIVVYNNKLYMSGFDTIAGTQLWRSDGTTEGTIKVTNFPKSFSPSKLYSFQDKLIMTGNNTVIYAVELFASDGTAAGTVCPTPPANGVDAFIPWQRWVPFNNSLYYRAAYGYFGDYQLCRFVNNAVSVKEIQKKDFPEAFVLFQNYPNPFNPSTSISFSIPSRSFVSLKVFDLLGREVATLVNEQKPAGTYTQKWNAANVSSGIYFYRLVANAIPSGQAGTFTETKKLLLLK
jgi:ELWxxDGT repeat protein